MKKFFGIILLTALISSVYGQDNISSELLSMLDSNSFYVENGRKMIIKNSKDGNFNKNIEILELLKSKVDEEVYYILYPAEERLVYFLAMDKEGFLNSIKTDNWSNTKIYPPNDNLHNVLIDELSQEAPLWQGWLEEQNLTDEERTAYRLYLGKIGFYTDNENLRKETKQFVKTYPESEYSDFVANLKNYFNTGSWGYSISGGDLLLMGEVTDYANIRALLGMETNFFTNRIYWSFYFMGSLKGELKWDIVGVNDDGETATYYAGNNVNYFSAGFRFGYLVANGKRLKLYPYASFAGSSVSVSHSNSDIGSMDLSSGFGLGAGLGLDYCLWSFKSDNGYGGYYNHHLGIRINIGTEKTLQSSDYLSSSALYGTAGIVWWMGD